MTTQDEYAFDLFRNGRSFIVTPDVGENNDDVTAREVTLTFAGQGLPPGASDENGEDNDLDWQAHAMQITVHFSDGNVLSGAAVNVGDSDDGNPNLWAVDLSLEGGAALGKTGAESAQTASLPTEFALGPNYPNPFNASTLWRIDLPESGQLRAVIYNLQGQKVVDVAEQRRAAGQQAMRWDGKNAAGQQVSSGVYLLRLIFEAESGARQMVTRRLILLR
ncbi:MAG: T9SS C-terminal target domain-containing protein [Chlorobi bacterium CHB1]|nr:T9SS C-terminal target domain-containing protein [Chlorobi bacterium CHB1]